MDLALVHVELEKLRNFARVWERMVRAVKTWSFWRSTMAHLI